MSVSIPECTCGCPSCAEYWAGWRNGTWTRDNIPDLRHMAATALVAAIPKKLGNMPLTVKEKAALFGIKPRSYHNVVAYEMYGEASDRTRDNPIELPDNPRPTLKRFIDDPEDILPPCVIEMLRDWYDKSRIIERCRLLRRGGGTSI